MRALLRSLPVFGTVTLCSELEDWLRRHGGYLQGPCVEKVPGRGWGLIHRGFAAPSEQLLLRVPWSLVLRKELVEEDQEVMRVLKQCSLESEKCMSQAIRLWLLRGQREAWRPWLEKLPKDVAAGADTLPLALSYQGSQALKGTPLQMAGDLQLQSLQKEWKDLGLEVPLESFLWAQAIVSTRSSSLPMDGQVVACLVPMVDFANHSFQPNAWIRGTKEGVELISCRSIEEGPACMSYFIFHPFFILVLLIIRLAAPHFLVTGGVPSGVFIR